MEDHGEMIDGQHSHNGMVDAGMRMGGHFGDMDLQKSAENSGIGNLDGMGECMPMMNNSDGVKASDYQHVPNVENGRYFSCAPAPPVEIKLFCGRVPKNLTEDEIRSVFEEYGVVKEVIIIRDKQSSAHKFSAFVKMGSIAHADAAIQALNGQKTLDHSLGPLQVKYANGEAERLNLTDNTASEPGVHQAKVFVGSLPKTVNEEQIRELFSMYGFIDEVFVMNDKATGQGKGCAFVKFAYKEQAINTIKNLDGKKTLEGCSRPVEVRFAESKTQRQQQNQFQGTVQNQAASPYPTMMGPPMGMMHHHTSVAHSNQQPRSSGVWKEYWTTDMRPYYFNEQSQVTQWERPAEFDSGVPQMGGVGAMQNVGGVGGNMTSGDATGPKGANIFIFYVPNEWSQNDLIQSFGSFGNIVSARIATDKTTGRNKGYAFVSYETPQSAAHAVHSMNGFLALSKRLKVSIKKGEESYVQSILDQLAAGGGAGSGTGRNMSSGGVMGNVAGGYAMGGMPQNAPPQYNFIGHGQQRYSPY